VSRRISGPGKPAGTSQHTKRLVRFSFDNIDAVPKADLEAALETYALEMGRIAADLHLAGRLDEESDQLEECNPEAKP
jgi:hypothetical protein